MVEYSLMCLYAIFIRRIGRTRSEQQLRNAEKAENKARKQRPSKEDLQSSSSPEVAAAPITKSDNEEQRDKHV